MKKLKSGCPDDSNIRGSPHASLNLEEIFPRIRGRAPHINNLNYMFQQSRRRTVSEATALQRSRKAQSKSATILLIGDFYKKEVVEFPIQL